MPRKYNIRRPPFVTRFLCCKYYKKGTKVIIYKRDLCDYLNYLRQGVEEGPIIPRLIALLVCQYRISKKMFTKFLETRNSDLVLGIQEFGFIYYYTLQDPVNAAAGNANNIHLYSPRRQHMSYIRKNTRKKT